MVLRHLSLAASTKKNGCHRSSWEVKRFRGSAGYLLYILLFQSALHPQEQKWLRSPPRGLPLPFQSDELSEAAGKNVPQTCPTASWRKALRMGSCPFQLPPKIVFSPPPHCSSTSRMPDPVVQRVWQPKHSRRGIRVEITITWLRDLHRRCLLFILASIWTQISLVIAPCALFSLTPYCLDFRYFLLYFPWAVFWGYKRLIIHDLDFHIVCIDSSLGKKWREQKQRIYGNAVIKVQWLPAWALDTKRPRC